MQSKDRVIFLFFHAMVFTETLRPTVQLFCEGSMKKAGNVTKNNGESPLSQRFAAQIH